MQKIALGLLLILFGSSSNAGSYNPTRYEDEWIGSSGPRYATVAPRPYNKEMVPRLEKISAAVCSGLGLFIGGALL